MMVIAVREVPRLALIGLTYVGAVSRFTHGRYTPAFYRYQVERAPDDASTQYIPFVDLAVGTLLCFSSTKSFAALLCVAFQGFGIFSQLRKAGQVLPDVFMFSNALVALWLSPELF
jgi:hypothetical protein